MKILFLISTIAAFGTVLFPETCELNQLKNNQIASIENHNELSDQNNKTTLQDSIVELESCLESSSDEEFQEALQITKSFLPAIMHGVAQICRATMSTCVAKTPLQHAILAFASTVIPAAFEEVAADITKEEESKAQQNIATGSNNNSEVIPSKSGINFFDTSVSKKDFKFFLDQFKSKYCEK